MDHWNDYGGGYLNGKEGGTPGPANKTAARQHFLCPVTARQVLEAPEDGLKVGSLMATMVSLVGLVSDIETNVTHMKFNLTDDTGSVECLEWVDSEDGKPKNCPDIWDNTYYHVYGCIKFFRGRPKIMIFKAVPIKNFNEVSAFILEVLNVHEYAGRGPKMVNKPPQSNNECYSNKSFKAFEYDKTAFTPVQKTVLDAIKGIETQVGWSKYDPQVRKMFSAKQIQDALDFLVSEGHIYTTVDDDHYSST